MTVGHNRKLMYQHLQDAALAIRNGAQFIGTNPDRTLPTPIGEIPGNGAILAALEAARSGPLDFCYLAGVDAGLEREALLLRSAAIFFKAT